MTAQLALPTSIFGGASHAEMAWIPGGTFHMCLAACYPEDAPAQRVALDGCWIDCDTETDEQLARFTAATDHVTVAERPRNPADDPTADPRSAGGRPMANTWHRRFPRRHTWTGHDPKTMT